MNEKSFQDRLLEHPFLEEVKIHRIITNETMTKSNKTETSVSFLNEEEEVLSIDISEEKDNFFIIRNSLDNEILFYLQVETNGDSYITHVYDNKMILRRDNQCFVEKQNYLIIPTKVYNSEITTRGWFGKNSNETINECYERHMNSEMGQIISVIYGRTMGAAGIASAHAGGFLSCLIYRK